MDAAMLCKEARAAALVLASCLFALDSEAGVARRDLRVTTADGVGLYVRELKPSSGAAQEPLIMIHGARVAGIGSFDLPVAGGSLAADIAEHTGRTVYVMDVRGYGASDRPPAMERPPAEGKPLSRAYEVVRDIGAVAREAACSNGQSQVALLGWATGGMWASFYASLYPEKVSHLIAFNSLYGGSDQHPTLGGRDGPPLGAYSLSTAASLFTAWDRSIPLEDKSKWRDPAVVKAYEEAAFVSDPTSSKRQPPSFRAPSGAIEDSSLQASGRRLFDASSITARVLLIRAGRDFWSRAEDVSAFQHDASRAAQVQVLTLPDSTHHVHLDRAERGRDQMIQAIERFLALKPS
jgi:pimeloyl-ACP methyl ester carboxylesterase